ncbi:MAG: hypothetical protein ACI8TX_000667 [Hyphomicrobiaceae bacterium]|jgi:hypothetical protein
MVNATLNVARSMAGPVETRSQFPHPAQTDSPATETMNAPLIWLSALALYGLFSLWYNNWHGPLRPDEIDYYMDQLVSSANETPDSERLSVIRKFLETDDATEFFMVNLIRLRPGKLDVAGLDAPTSAGKVLEKYTGYFLPALLRRAGHPAFYGRAAGGYVESWGVEANPGWSLAGVVRYRSRRDMIVLATNPAFEPAHVFKVAALEKTFAFPATPGLVIVGPRIWVALVLSLVAALLHLLLVTSGASA